MLDNPAVCFLSFTSEEGDNYCIMKFVWDYLFLPYAIQDAVELVSGLAALKISTGRPLVPGAYLMLVYLITFLTSTRFGGRSWSSIIAIWGIRSQICSINSTRVCYIGWRNVPRTTLWCFLCFSVRQYQHRRARGWYWDMRGHKQQQGVEELFKAVAVSKLLGFISSVDPPNILCLRVPSGLCSSGIWSRLSLIVMLHHFANL